MNFELDKVVESIRIVDTERNYWFVRTYSGILFDDFFDRSFVAIGFNSIPMGLIKKASESKDGSIISLKTAIQNAYDLKQAEVTKVAKQLIDFHQNVKIGDMIIMPSENSNEFAFGLVESDIYQVNSKSTFKFREANEPFPEKRRKIKWLKTLEKGELNGDLRNLSSTRSAISNASGYKDIIEGHLSSVYIREDKLYLTIKIDQEEDINAFAFSEFLSGLTYFYAEFCKENGEDYNEELYLKIKVQSKGSVALKCFSIAAGVSLTGLFILADNSEAKMDLAGMVKVEGKSTGLLKSITNFLDASQERRHKEEKFQDSMQRLKATTVSEPVKKEDDSVSHNLDSVMIVGSPKITALPRTEQKKIGANNSGKKQNGNNKRKDN